MSNELHRGQPVLTAGAPLNQARLAIVLIHGRGATAENILELAEELEDVERSTNNGIAFLAPQAFANTWYPNSFLAPIQSNEPWLSSALETIRDILNKLKEGGIPSQRIFLLGFSQGACLGLEYTARHPQRFAGVVGLSGGLIGPDDTPQIYPGSLDGTPVFLGCSDVDIHIPKERVQITAEVLKKMGAMVTVRLYPNMAHTVNQDEVNFIRGMLQSVLGS